MLRKVGLYAQLSLYSLGNIIDELLGGGMDLEEARDTFRNIHAAIEDLNITMNDFIADGDQVVVQWTHRHPPGRTE